MMICLKSSARFSIRRKKDPKHWLEPKIMKREGWSGTRVVKRANYGLRIHLSLLKEMATSKNPKSLWCRGEVRK